MDRDELLARTKKFGVRIIKLSAALPKNQVGDTIGRQLLRSGTSVGANYHEACHASSNRHFITTMEVAQREARETEYWLDLVEQAELINPHQLADLRAECSELIAILTASIRTAKSNTTK
ncbi:MAG: four helix bundle protein [Planctomycetota bacterium]